MEFFSNGYNTKLVTIGKYRDLIKKCESYQVL